MASASRRALRAVLVKLPEPAAERLRGRLPRAVVGLLSRSTRRARRLSVRLYRQWRRSLRIRVVATTTLLGLIVVLGVGDFLLARIRDGLVVSRRQSALTEADGLTRTARQGLAAADYHDASSQGRFVADMLDSLEGAAGSSSPGIVLVRSLRSREPITMSGRSIGVQPSDIPQSLRNAVNAAPRQQQVQLTEVMSADGRRTPALAVGSIVDVPLSGPYELYFVFSLEREQQILDLVQRTFLAGGVALVLLVGAVSFTVTRQVVRPIRQAAQTAEELASGRLDRRMRVRGEDDVARLGRAFNEMASGLERQIHQLEELSRVQRRFVSDVSHELRTPLTTIRMASEVIHESRHDLDPVLSRSAELLQNQLDRFESLLADLLEISRFDAGAAMLDVEPADVREVVGRVVEVLVPLADRRGSVLRVDAPGTACLAEIDSRRVERIVRNLVGNAIEHGDGRPIEISIGLTSDAVAVGVRDHGVGLDEDDLAMVFNRFWRGDPARARTTGGTGLGLSIAKEDANLHGGWLQAWGAPGVGANFRLTLPRRCGAPLSVSPLPLSPDAEDAEPPPPLVIGPPSGQFPLPVPGPPAGVPIGTSRSDVEELL